MKKLSAFVFSIVLVCALLALVGCGQTEGSSGGGKAMMGSTQNSLSSQDSQRSSGSTQGSQSSQNGVRVSVVDVGKGDCILVQAGGASALIDSGYEDTANEVVSYLRNQGISSLDCLVITHYDRDHIGGISAVGKAFDIGTIYIPGYKGGDKHYRAATDAIDDLEFSVQPVIEEQALDLGGASFTILPSDLTYIPNANGKEGNDNDLSLVATLTFQNDSYLFTGDLEEEGIASYLKNGRGQYDVLKVPHHGEKNSFTDDLLEVVQPKIALITDSAKDPADKKVLKLLQSSGVDIYRTSTDGTIVVESAGAGSDTVSTSG